MDVALPKIASLSDCADFSKTILPFVPQLRALPELLGQTWSSPQDLKQLYLATNPVISALAVALALIPLLIIISEIKQNSSQIDQLWSIIPGICNAHFVLYAHLAGLPTQRLDTLLAVSTLWSVRLTYNYWRKGGYAWGAREDYRATICRQRLGRPLFSLFNAVYLHFSQTMLLVGITLPTYILLLAARFTGDDESTTNDLIVSRAMAGMVLLEFFADQQQWDFQQAKKQYQQTAKVPPKYHAEDLDRGFVVTGLWAWSRHPNFFAEQAYWTLLYQWSCLATSTLYNYTLVGPLAYMLLFQGSTSLTESLSAAKYPDYREYQQRVGKFLPRWSTDRKTTVKGK